MRKTGELPGLPTRRTSVFRASQIFEARAEALIDGWLARRNAVQGGAESPNAWFKREAYRLLRHYVDSELTKAFELVIRKDNRPSRVSEEARGNPFKLGLLAMFSDETLARSDRHVFGNQMLYAHRHDVPPEFLNGFLAVSGGPNVIAQKLKNGFVEPGFADRINSRKEIEPTSGGGDPEPDSGE